MNHSRVLKQIKAKHRNDNAKLQAQLSEMKIELESKGKNFDTMEKDLSLQIMNMNLNKKNNELEIAELMKSLEIKNPIYEIVKTEAMEKDTIYNKLKSHYAAKVSSSHSNSESLYVGSDSFRQ